MFKITPQLQLMFFIAAAFLVDYIPFVNLPFLWSETFFHEISHGLAAILTGGVIQSITLNFNGSGLCVTTGGLNFIISFAGYAGSVFWGFLIYSIASALSPARSKILVACIAAMLGLTLLLWARGLSTVIILIILLAIYVIPLYKTLWFSVKSFIQLMGIFVMLDAIRSPLYLLDGRDLGDGAALAEMTWLPEIFWIGLWFTIAVGSIYWLWVTSKQVKH